MAVKYVPFFCPHCHETRGKQHTLFVYDVNNPPKNLRVKCKYCSRITVAFKDSKQAPEAR